VGWSGLGAALRVLLKSSDVFPPLKSAVSGLLEGLDILQVSSKSPIIDWRLIELYLKAASKQRDEYETLTIDLTGMIKDLELYLRQSKSTKMSESVANVVQ
jgi:hypothetical protein